MQELINDLLTYSLVDRRGKEFKIVDMINVLQNIEKSLNILIKENNEQITDDPFRKLQLITHIVQLLQNLIVNSIKYRSHDNLKINISAREGYGYWIF